MNTDTGHVKKKAKHMTLDEHTQDLYNGIASAINGALMAVKCGGVTLKDLHHFYTIDNVCLETDTPFVYFDKLFAMNHRSEPEGEIAMVKLNLESSCCIIPFNPSPTSSHHGCMFTLYPSVADRLYKVDLCFRLPGNSFYIPVDMVLDAIRPDVLKFMYPADIYRISSADGKSSFYTHETGTEWNNGSTDIDIGLIISGF